MSSHDQLLSPAGEPYFSFEGLSRLSEPLVMRASEREVPPLVDMDSAIFFMMTMSLLFVAQLATISAALFSLSVIVYAMRHRGALGEVLRTQTFFLLFAAYGLISTLWSVAPGDTFKHAVEFTLTVIGALFLARARNRRSMLFALFASFAVYTLASLAFGNMVSVGTSGTTALSGLADSKNDEASIVGTGAIISLAWFFVGLRTHRYSHSVLALPVLAAELYAAVLARSAGAMASLAVGTFTFLLLAMLSKTGRRFRVALVGFGGVLALASAMLFLVFTGPIVDAVSGWFGKDVTLTGRIYLWARARDLIVEHPIVGSGFDGFWQQGNLDAEGLWQFGHIADRTGFNFHNTSYDILVSLGWLGLILFLLTLIVGLVKMAAAYVRAPTLLASFWLAMAASMVVRMPVETLGIYEFSSATIFLFAIFGFAVNASRARRDAFAERQMTGRIQLGLSPTDSVHGRRLL
jgi:exopolysaccharide production protein ExoQ